MKYLLGESTAEEQQTVETWLSEEVANRQYYNQLKQVWDSSKELAAVSAVDENKAWERFQQRVAGAIPGPTGQVVKRISFLKVAASIILAVGLGLTAYFIAVNNSRTKDVIVHTQQNMLTDTLSDGSVVTLNKQSSLTYPDKFRGKIRPVTLKGEAFFQVAPNKEKPFIISVNDVEVTVVGTSFNIRSDAVKTEVVVETGVVRIMWNRQTTELRAGEKLLLSAKDTIPVKEVVTDKLYNYYRSREFVCDDTPLWKLVEVLNEAYDTRIIIGRKELSDLRLNATFNNESLDKVLEIIHLTFNISVVKKEGQIILQ